MSSTLLHTFVSGKADGADATLVQPTNWNDGHKFTGGNNGDFLQRDTSDATYGAKWTPLITQVNSWTALQTFAGGARVTGDGGAGVGALRFAGNTLVWQVGTNGLIVQKADDSAPLVSLLNTGLLTVNAGAVSAKGFIITGDPGIGQGAIRLVTTQILHQGAAGGFVWQKSDNSAGLMTLSDAGVLDVPGAAAHHGKVTFSVAPMVPAAGGTAVFGVDCTDSAALSIINTGTAYPFGNFNNFSGMFLINEQAVTAECALVGARGGLTYIIWQSGTGYSTTAATAGKVNITAAGGAVLIENLQGSTLTFKIMSFRTRVTA